MESHSPDPQPINSNVRPNWRENPIWEQLLHFPWWAILIAFMFVLVALAVYQESSLQVILNAILEGVSVTILATLIAFPLAILLGLILALARLSSNIIAYQLGTLYVEVIRGFPALVFLFWIAFPATTTVIGLINSIGQRMLEAGILPSVAEGFTSLQSRNVDYGIRVIVALVLAYASFISEIFRAGIVSIDRGQVEAALALGMTGRQAMIYVVLPQAIKRVIPPLGNDFIAMLKDSSLVSALGVRDMTYQARTYSASTFKFEQTYNILAVIYLSLTLLLSMVVRQIEKRLKNP